MKFGASANVMQLDDDMGDGKQQSKSNSGLGQSSGFGQSGGGGGGGFNGEIENSVPAVIDASSQSVSEKNVAVSRMLLYSSIDGDHGWILLGTPLSASWNEAMAAGNFNGTAWAIDGDANEARVSRWV